MNKTSEGKSTSPSGFRFDLVPEETLTLNVKYRETLHSFLRGKSLNSHSSSSDFITSSAGWLNPITPEMQV